MPKGAKTQWDFGELFPVAQARKVYSVQELTAQVKRLLEKQLGQVWVSGEITNLRAQSSGHVYFTIKDANAQLACVLFRGESGARRDLLADGQKVVVQGDLTVYEARGQYQLIVRTVEQQGVGALQLAFEQLKQKLTAEGLFAPERKRPLPRYVQRIGLATSPTGAAIQDVLTVIRRRHPGLEIILAPCRVQGQGAAAEIASAVKNLNAWSAAAPEHALDLILVTRGGGSLEDLWAFNEEALARAIFHSAIPVVSAVGHEIDFTISDFVADLRAPTPSAAAEIITEGAFAAQRFIAESSNWMQQHLTRRIQREVDTLTSLQQRLIRAHPRRKINEHWQRLDDLSGRLERSTQARWREAALHWNALCQRIVRLKPMDTVRIHQEQLGRCQQRLEELMQRRLTDARQKLQNAETQLRLLSPPKTLARGYSITMDDVSGKILRKASDTLPGQKLRTHLHEGEIRSVVTKP
jgi:exodeoxyribonuclease VII large subunit